MYAHGHSEIFRLKYISTTCQDQQKNFVQKRRSQQIQLCLKSSIFAIPYFWFKIYREIKF